MQIQCSECGKTIGVPETFKGKQVRCKCGQTLQIPNPAAVTAPGTAAAYRPPRRTQRGASGAEAGAIENYWWLMTYIKINHILGYVFLGILVIGALVLVVSNLGTLSLMTDLPVGGFLVGIFGMILGFVSYCVIGFVYLVIWFASADFLRAVVDIAENTRRIH